MDRKDQLRALMDAAGESKEGVAALGGVSRVLVSYWLNGKRKITDPRWDRIYPTLKRKAMQRITDDLQTIQRFEG